MIGLLLVAPAASAFTLGAVSLDEVEQLAPAVSYLVGFHEFPRGIERGDEYEGGRVVHVDEVLHFVTVETRSPLTFQARAHADERVRYVEANGFWSITYTPNDPKYGSEQYGPQNIGAPAAWDTTLGDTSVKVCIVDTGIRSTHEDVGRYVAGYDFVSNDATPQDGNGHGTHVATTALATTNNGKGIAGVAQSSLLVARVLDNAGSGSYDWIASGIRWCADNGAHVISMSLGGSSTTTALSDAVTYAAGKGSLQIAAAGNSGPCTNCVGYPAKYAEVMAVACTTSSRAQCSFSSEGPEVDITAPGNGIVAGWHTGDAAYNTISGTSMSTPHVSGVAALVKTANPAFTKEDIRSTLQTTARDLGTGGWDADFGHGEVDAAAAVGGGTPPPPPPSESRVFFEDFDDGAANGWTLGGLWHVSSACSAPPSTPSYVGYNEDSDCQYSTGARTTGSAAVTVDTTGATVGTLKFQHRWETESYSGGAYDVMRVEASSNGGSSWSTLRQWDSRDANQLSWGAASLDLDAVVGGSLMLRFFFDTVDSTANNYAGWFVDSVEVTADSGGSTPPPNAAPTANAGADQTHADDDGSGAESVALNGAGSTDSDGTISSYVWSEGSTQLATGATPTVSLGVGSHTITLTVTDDDGATDTDTVVVTVNANQAPSASFTRSVSGLSVSVDGRGSSDPDGTIASYAWSWGDGTTGSGSTASHAYASAGTYTITLTVTDNGGATGSASASVTVSAGATVVYSENFDDGSAQGWSKSSSTDLWHIEDGCVADYSPAYKLAWTRAGNCDYNTGARVTNWAQSGAISLAGASQATLKFVHRFDIEQYSGGAYDILRVQVSSDGATWTTLQQWDSRGSDVTSWTAMSYSLNAYAGGNVYLRVWTDTVDSYGNAQAGWFIDDVSVTTA